jgi:hypothetical protein
MSDMTTGELSRALEQFRRDMREDQEVFRREIREDFAEFRGSLAQLVPREVYQSERAALVERVVRVETEVAALRAERAADHKAVQSARRQQVYAFVGAAGLALLLLLINAALKSKGA